MKQPAILPIAGSVDRPEIPDPGRSPLFLGHCARTLYRRPGLHFEGQVRYSLGR